MRPAPAPRGAPRTTAVRVGTSGWTYQSWRAHLFKGLPQRRWLERIAEVFDAVEINGSFYTQIAPATYRRWYDETPATFRFALKGHRFVTHYKQLRDTAGSIERLREQASPLADKLGAVLVDRMGGPVAVDQERMVQLLDNLVTNAVRYGEGTVTVTLARDVDEAVVTVHNGGPPIAPEKVAGIFDPYRRGSSVRGGVGLGLYIVQQIARAHGGTVDVESSAAAGTTFTIRFPADLRAPAPTPAGGLPVRAP